MTAAELLNIEWSPLFNYPKVRCPNNARTVARQVMANEYGVEYEARIETNRTRNRWWLTVQREGWMRTYLTTTSERKRDEWLSAFNS